MFFFFNDTAPTEIYTLSLHDALPIYRADDAVHGDAHAGLEAPDGRVGDRTEAAVDRDVRPAGRPVVLALDLPDRRAAADRKSTRLNSSHANISYAVFCLKKKNTTELQ